MIDIEKFSKWLAEQGAEVLPVTNEFEAVRFKGKEVGVLYKSGKTSNMFTAEAVSSFIRGKKWDGKPVSVGRKNTYLKEKTKILTRDGDKCFLCNEPLADDITIEHLIPLVSGGKNELSNMVLTHEECNRKLGVRPVFQKMLMALEYRMGKHSEEYSIH